MCGLFTVVVITRGGGRVYDRSGTVTSWSQEERQSRELPQQLGGIGQGGHHSSSGAGLSLTFDGRGKGSLISQLPPSPITRSHNGEPPPQKLRSL